jgi:hypothetical protein
MVMFLRHFAVVSLIFFPPIFSQFAGLSDVSISQDIPIEGEITIPSRARAQEHDSSTLNESIRRTIVS